MLYVMTGLIFLAAFVLLAVGSARLARRASRGPAPVSESHTLAGTATIGVAILVAGVGVYLYGDGIGRFVTTLVGV